MLLSPEQFARLTEYASYSSHKLLDMLAEFQPNGMFFKYLSDDLQTIDFDGFTHFMNCYLGAELPADLIQQLFLSFVANSASIFTDGEYGASSSGYGAAGTAAASASAMGALPPAAAERRLSVFEDAMHTVKNVFAGVSKGDGASAVQQHAGESAIAVAAAVAASHEPPSLRHRRIPLKPLVCYLSLLEGAPPEDKLEFVFHVYDSDGNGYLDNKEIEGIIEQMMNVARYQQWDTIELEPILRQMMAEIDYDNDGIVSLNEWKRGGLTTIPLLVLLGFDTEMKEDGCHIWRLRHFSKPTYCNVCSNLLLGWGGKQGLACTLCKYTVHERCVCAAQNTCIHTYNANPAKRDAKMFHHWIDSNNIGKCAKCKTTVPIFQGKICRWCKYLLHTRCVDVWPKECDFGPYAYHMLSPIDIIPTFLDRTQSQQQSQQQQQQQQSQPQTPTSRSHRHNSYSCGTGAPFRTRYATEVGGARPRQRYSNPSNNAYGYANSNNNNNGCYSNNGPSPSFSAAGGGPSTTGAGNNLLQVVPQPSNSRNRPLLVLINPKSGGRQGQRIYNKFQYLLNPRQVYDLCKDGPEPGLNLFKTIKNANILVCGGDGTVGWVLDAMDKIDYGTNNRPPVAVLPLGTGNDLARCLKWGGGYENGPLEKILQSIEKGSQIYMDRWQITIEQTKKCDKGDPQPYHIINNYFSIGVDASIAHRFHVMREKYPEKFNSRMRNKFWYFELGTSETLSSTCKNLHEQIDILCDGETIDLGNGPNLEGIALLNIASIYGGSNLWGNSRRTSTSWHIPIIFPQITNSSIQLQHRVQDVGDRLIEVVGLESAIQMGQIKAGVRAAARRLSQCSTVVIQTHKSFPMQIDGEPWMQPPCIIQIIHKNQVPMLSGNRKRGTWNLLKRQMATDK